MEFTFEDPEVILAEQPVAQPIQQAITPQPMAQPQPQQQIAQPQFTFEDPEQQPYFNPEMPRNESWLQTLTRVPVGVASTAAKSVGKFADFMENLQGNVQEYFGEERKERTPFSEFISEENIEKGLDKLFPKKYREPKNTFIEQSLHRVAGDLPWIGTAIATGGISAAPMAAARAAGSAVGSEAAKSAGFGELGEAIGGLVGSLGADTAKRFFKEDGIQKFGKAIQKAMYEESEPIAKAIIRNAQPAEEELRRVMAKAAGTSSGMEKSMQKSVFQQLENADRIISQGKVNLQDAIDQKKHFNKLIRDLPHNENTKRAYYKQAVGAFNRVIDQAEKEIPAFGKPYRIGEDLSKTIGIAEKAADTAKEAMNTSVLKRIPILNYFDKPLWLLSNSIPPEFAPYARNNPKIFGKYLGKVAQSAVIGDVATTRRHLENIAKYINHIDKKEKKSKS